MALTNKLSAIGDAIREKTGKTDLMTLDEMPLEISAITTTGGGGIVPPESALTLTGDIRNMFANGTWDWYIEQIGDQITTKDIYGETIFFNSKVERIPFTLNKHTNGYYTNSQWFTGCNNLKELPDITGQFGNSYNFCGNCYNIQRIPDSWIDIDYSFVNQDTSWSYCRHSNFFHGCRSLRYIPEGFLKKIWSKYNGNFVHSDLFYYCVSLDEIVGLRGNDTTVTSNQFSNTFAHTYRLKRLVFDMDNGSPRVQNWSNQTIDLSNYVGYASDRSYILNYNSGITADKEVSDYESYEALMEDEDWFTLSPEFSRYDYGSAWETICSLPDTSAYLASNGGTNTIKFKGSAGEYTPNGAINMMPEEEIAVATAKGWTVSFV